MKQGPSNFAYRIVCAVILVASLGGCVTAGTGAREVADDQAGAAEAQRTDPDLFYYVGAAEIYGMRENFAEAAKFYQLAAQLSDDPEIAARAVRVATYAKDQDLMLAGAQRWLELDSSNLEAHRIAGSLLLSDGEVERAWPHFKELLDRGDPASSWEALKDALVRSPDRAAALEIFRRLRELPAPLELSEIKRLSDLGIVLGDLEGASYYTDLALEMDPNDAKSWAWRGRLRRMQGDLEGALQDLARAVELDPGDQILRRAYAEILAESNDFSAALNQLDQVDPDMEVLYTKAIYALRAEQPARVSRHYAELQSLTVEDADEKSFFLGRLAEAIERPADETLSWYRQVRGGDRIDDARLRTAMVLARSDRLEQAQAVLHRLQNGNAEAASRAFIAEGGLLHEADDSLGAMAVYDRGLELLPDNVDLLFTRGLLAEELDRLDKTEADLRRVLELQPDNFNAMNALGYTLADRTDRYEEALELIEKAMQRAPNSAAIVDSMGWVQFKLGNYDDAITLLQRALDLQFDQEIAAHLGEVLWTVGRQEEAQNVWAEALEQAPDSEVILATRQRLSN